MSVHPNDRRRQLVSNLRGQKTSKSCRIGRVSTMLGEHPNVRHLCHDIERFTSNGGKVICTVDVRRTQQVTRCCDEQKIGTITISDGAPTVRHGQVIRRFERKGVRILIGISMFDRKFSYPSIRFMRLTHPALSLTGCLRRMKHKLQESRNGRTYVLVSGIKLCHVFKLPARQ